MKIVRTLWKILVGIKDALVLVLMLLFFGGLLAALSAHPSPKLASSGALLLDFNGSIVEQPREADPFGALAGNESMTREYRLRDVVRAIDTAARADGVKAVVLDLDRFAGGGQAALAAVGEALDRVRRAGKPVLAYGVGYDDQGYQLAAHASEIWLDPMGGVLIQGPGSPHLYYKGLLDKLGVVAKVYRVGKFKSFVEPYTRSDMSPEAREAAQALADSLWGSWQQEVGHARPQAKLADYVAHPDMAAQAAGGDLAQAALKAGLVDKLGDRTAFGRRVAQFAGAGDGKTPGSFATLKLANWIEAHDERTGGAGIGVVTIAGDIVDGRAGPGSAAGDTVSTLILKALAKKDLKALVVRVDSPGGSVLAAEKIRAAILEARRDGLPIAVSMGSVAASGGYWVSTPADRIFAEPATITGSIGVFGIIPTFQGTLQKTGLAADGVGTTPLSGQPDVFRGTSPVFDTVVQLGVNDIYAKFTNLVAQSRKLPVARVDEIAQGRVWAGGTARQLGLVDQFGGLDDAIAWAATRAGLDPDKVHPVFIEREPTAWKKFLRDLLRKDDNDGDGATDARDPWGRIAGDPRMLLARAMDEVRRVVTGPTLQARCLECPMTGTAAPVRETRLLAILLGR